MSELVVVAVLSWVLAAVLALIGRPLPLARGLLALGGIALIAFVCLRLPQAGEALAMPFGIGPVQSNFELSPGALWLLGFGLIAAVLAAIVGSPATHQRAWIFGAAASLIGTLGVFGLQDAMTFLIAWEFMSLGGAVMMLGEDLATDTGRSVLFMLALLEAGAVALILAFIILTNHAGSFSFSSFSVAASHMPRSEQLFVGFLLLVGFGAKLGLLPFYEWYPSAYATASGATGAFLSGVVLNAAFFGLARGLIEWLPVDHNVPVSLPGIFVVILAVVSAILTALYAFQQEDWRELLSLSSAENASIAVCLLGAALMFRRDNLLNLAGLAWAVSLLHLAGHSLAKGTMFLSADGVYRAARSYRLAQRGILARNWWPYGVGALFAAMSLAAMPPQAGFVSEWYLFQTFFQGFHLDSLASRLTTALAGAGLALTAAIAFATFLKVFGIGLLGRAIPGDKEIPRLNCLAVGLLGILVLITAVAMPVLLNALRGTTLQTFGADTIAKMHVGPLLVPATGAPIRLPDTFAFISPSLLVIVMPLLAILPVGLLLIAHRRFAVRRAEVWYGGFNNSRTRSATTGLTFSNALRTFYSFIYRPTVTTQRELSHETNGHPYFVRKLTFSHDVAPIFGPYLFATLERFTNSVSERLRLIQSGSLNIYLAFIGALLIIILLIALF